MRFSNLFCPTLKEVPNDAEIISHQLMLRAGFIRKVAAGIYSYLPLGLKVIKKFENIVREEMGKAGAQEVFMPSVISAELWQESGRWHIYGKELLRFKDRHDKDFCMGPTHEEVIVNMVRGEVKSYRQLPLNLFQIQTKFRDEIRPRFGLMRGREFTMKDAYSFHASWEDLDETYNIMQRTYQRIFERCGLQTKVVEADSGAIGGNTSAEIMVIANTGEDEIIECSVCGYTANSEAAEIAAPEKDNFSSFKNKYQEVETPNVKTIEELCAFFKTSADKFIKALIYLADNKPIMVLLRGDHSANEIKIKKAIKCENFFPADEKTIEKLTGVPTGFSGPIGLKETCLIIADFGIKTLEKAVIGANKKDMHLQNVVPQNDFQIENFYDLRKAAGNDICPRCNKGVFKVVRGIEVGHIFKLGTKYSKALNATYLDAEGKQQFFIMGCYGIGIGRTVAAAIEQHHDDQGIIWPLPLAPYQVDIILAGLEDTELTSYAEKVYEVLLKNNVEVILDDRPISAGIKFKDADLIGFPIQIIIGKNLKIEGKIEVKVRQTKERILIEENMLLKTISQLISNGS